MTCRIPDCDGFMTPPQSLAHRSRPQRRKAGTFVAESETWIDTLLTCLFDGDRLGQIPRLVDIGALVHGNVVGEQLQR